MSKWTKRVRTCNTIYTHPDILHQVIVNNSTGQIVWANKEFEDIETALEYAEFWSFK